MKRVFGLLFVIAVCCVTGQQIVNRVWLRNTRQYMVDVIQEVVKTVEERGWWNLKLKDIEYDLNETVFSRDYKGPLTYKNGFLVSVQQLDVLQSSITQIWNITDGQVHVNIRGQLRMSGVSLGYDIQGDMEDGKHHYTGTITHPLVTYDFWVGRIIETRETWATVFGNLQQSGNIINILPSDDTSDAFTTLFYVGDTEEGLVGWTEELKQIAEDVIKNRVPFPDLCYNCPIPTE